MQRFSYKNITYLILSNIDSAFRTLSEGCPQLFRVHDSPSLTQSPELGEMFLHLSWFLSPPCQVLSEIKMFTYLFFFHLKISKFSHILHGKKKCDSKLSLLGCSWWRIRWKLWRTGACRLTLRSSPLNLPPQERNLPEQEGAEEVWAIHDKPSEISFAGSGINT